VRYRHPCERGSYTQRILTLWFRPMMTNSFWKRHTEPWSKTRAGRLRRQERRFVVRQKEEYARTPPVDG